MESVTSRQYWLDNGEVLDETSHMLARLGMSNVTALGILVTVADDEVLRTSHSPERHDPPEESPSWISSPFDQRQSLTQYVGHVSVAVTTLGPLEMSINGHAISPSEWRQAGAGARNVRKLLAYLLHCRHTWLSREAIQDAVWPNEQNLDLLPRRFYKSLTGVNEVFAVALPRAQSPAISAHQGRYQLSDAYSWTVDVDAFSAVISEADAVATGGDVSRSISLYSEALGMYGGDYMMDIPYEDVEPGAVPLANWWIESREEMNAKRRYARRRLAQLYLAKQKPQLVIDLWSTALREPEQDIDDLRALGLLALTAYAEAGREIEGLRAFDSLKLLLPTDEGGTGRKLAAAAEELKQRLYGMEKSGRSS